MLPMVKDHGLLNKSVYMKKKLVTQLYTTDCINIKKEPYIYNVLEQNDCHKCDRYKLCNAPKNLPMADF